MTTLDDIGERLDQIAQALGELDADLAQLAGDRPAAPIEGAHSMKHPRTAWPQHRARARLRQAIRLTTARQRRRLRRRTTSTTAGSAARAGSPGA